MAAAAVAGAVGLAACSSTPAAPGVTASTVRVGALVAGTGPAAADYADAADGVRAYFAMVDARGGVDGRQLVLADVADDAGTAAGDVAAAHTLVERDGVFAVVGVATPAFAAAGYLAGTGTPTFGQVTSAAWAGHGNLFGTFGSVLDVAAPAQALTWMAHQVGATSAAVVAYGGSSVSTGTCRAAAAALGHGGVAVRVADYDFTAGASPDIDVLKMAAGHVQLVVSCLDGADGLRLEQVMKSSHLNNAYSVWTDADAYSRLTVAQDPLAMQKVFFVFPHVPFEAAATYATYYPGMAAYVEAMDRYEPAATFDEAALQGWIDAAQFVAGLRAVGHGTLSQQALVGAVDAETAFTAGGLMPPVDWGTAHTRAPSPHCSAFTEVFDGATVAALLHPVAQLLTCFGTASAVPVTSPAGTPGAGAKAAP